MQTVAATAGRFAEIFPPTASQMYDTRLQETNRSRALPRWFPAQLDVMRACMCSARVMYLGRRGPGKAKAAAGTGDISGRLSNGLPTGK